MLSDGDRVIVALGELTGHAHAFAQAARLFREEPSGLVYRDRRSRRRAPS